MLPRQGDVGQKCQHLAVGPTCHQHVGNFPSQVMNPQANAILEHIHGVLGNMLRTSELNMAELEKTSDINVFLSDAALAICSTYHTVLKASPCAAIFGQAMLFDIPFIADWQKIGEYRQRLTETPVKTKAELIMIREKRSNTLVSEKWNADITPSRVTPSFITR
jgi:hypothetical protein